jgi:hypothetical protein
VKADAEEHVSMMAEDERIRNVFIHRDDRWQLVARHISALSRPWWPLCVVYGLQESTREVPAYFRAWHPRYRRQAMADKKSDWGDPGQPAEGGVIGDPGIGGGSGRGKRDPAEGRPKPPRSEDEPGTEGPDRNE